jgi:hypothetical protein
MGRKWLLPCALSTLSLLCGPVHADTIIFEGATLKFQYYLNGGVYNNVDSPVIFGTSGGTAFPLDFFHFFGIDAHYDNSVNKNVLDLADFTSGTWPSSPISLDSGGLFIEDGFLLTIVSGIQAFTSVSLDPVLSDLSGSNFSISGVTWNSTAIAVNFANVTFSGQDQLFLDITGTPAIPEPSTWAMILLGFVGFGFAARGRRAVGFPPTTRLIS